MKTFKQVVGLKSSGLKKMYDTYCRSMIAPFCFEFHSALNLDVFDIAEDRINNGESLTIELIDKLYTNDGQPALVHFEEDDFIIEEISYE